MLKGLNSVEVQESRKKYGENILTPKDKIPVWKKFLCKFTDPLIIILLVAGVLSLGISFYEYIGLDEESTVFFEPIGIFVAIFLATGLSFFFELKADKEFTFLNQVNDDEPVKVVREGKITEVPRRDVVVGDVVIVNAGDEIPADGNLVEAVSLSIDESSLTGEPVCRKTVKTSDFDSNATYPSNRLLRGTNVMEGHGVYVVDLVGDSTENGKVFKEAQIDSSVKTPLNEQLERLSKLITKASYVLAALIILGKIYVYVSNSGLSLSELFVGKEFVHFLAYLLNTLMLAVTLIVVAVPEGLPMAVTLSLAYSMRRMLRTNNLVRKMHACETMGATTVICTDKTGTLTQ
ncbi:MAG: HAD-IC family P-type ATPase, partial [Bacteroidaceae bacterium]|nr:HAD-IC family P-type ATPase [Bacteroidaceae bacterium]